MSKEFNPSELVIHSAETNHPGRIIPLEKGYNLRDIGGYTTAGGKQIKWGEIYRSGALHQLSLGDVATLGRLNVRTVIDMRSVEETDEYPDKLPSTPRPAHWLRPIKDPSRISRVKRLAQLILRRTNFSELMFAGYTETTIDQNAPVLGDILQGMAVSDNRPILVHCLAGKDRTGLVIALLLHILGVPRETILADYSLSNLFYANYVERVEADVTILKRLGLTAEHIRPMLLADPDLLRRTFVYIEEKYGAIETYLDEKAGVNETIRTRLKAELLE